MTISTTLATTLGGRLRTARQAAGLSQQDLAQRAGLVVRSVAGYEAGESTPGGDALRRICAALPISADVLLGLVPAPVVSEAPPASLTTDVHTAE